MITIIDYQMGNIGSIVNMFKRIGFETRIARERSDVSSATKLILPGVGSFDHGVTNLRKSRMLDEINRRVLQDGIPVLGICLGMQLLTHSSEEGSEPGLGWVDASVRKFAFPEDLRHLKIPHMGWNDVTSAKSDPLIEGLPEGPRYYFVHSYYVTCNDPADVLLKTSYGGEFVSALRKGNIMGVQFHPEKSHKYGMALLKNFATL